LIKIDKFSNYPFEIYEKIKITDEDLSIEQLPQLLNLSKSKEVEWKYNAKIIGPDESYIETIGEGNEIIIKTPLILKSIPWNFNKLDVASIKNMILDLIPCNEGNGYVNPSPWERDQLKPGEITDNYIYKDNLQNEIKIDTNLYNPYFIFLNPYFIQSTDKPIENSSFICVELDKAICIVSSQPFNLNFDKGKIDAKGTNLLIRYGKTWKEIKPQRLSWDLSNPIIDIDCKPKYNISLYRIEPSSIIPLFIKYNNGELILELINMSDIPVISTIYLTARILEAEILDENEKVVTEFDRVRIPFRKWGIHVIRLKIRKLIEQYLKRKII